MPKNQGLRTFAEEALAQLNLTSFANIELVPFRGEDIPEIVEKLIEKNETALGLTGQDLYTEYKLRRTESSLKIVKKFPWENPYYLFGKPALCLLGPSCKALIEFDNPITVAVNVRYEKLSQFYLEILEKQGFKFISKYVTGETERLVGQQLADVCIEIVCTGKNAREQGLRVYDKLLESNLVAVGCEVEM